MEVLRGDRIEVNSRDRASWAIGRISHRAFGLLGTAVLFLVVLATRAQPSTAPEHDVKAGFLVKFTQYVAWPSNTFTASRAPVVIGVLGEDPVLKRIELEAAGVTGSRPVVVCRVGTVEEASRCHLVFISQAESGNEAEWFGALKGKPILTVGESDRTMEHGAVMRFVIKNKTVRFEANLAASSDNRLELSERMLAVAAKVYRRPPGDSSP